MLLISVFTFIPSVNKTTTIRRIIIARCLNWLFERKELHIINMKHTCFISTVEVMKISWCMPVSFITSFFYYTLNQHIFTISTVTLFTVNQ